MIVGLKDTIKLLGISIIAKHFWVFGLSVFAGCALGFLMAFLYLPVFYELQNAEGLFPDFDVQFHPLLTFLLVGVPTIAMMRVFGYEDSTCSRAILGAYRPFSYIGFAIGTVYQFGLLKIMLAIMFADIENMPEYTFNFKVLVITLIAFIIIYELIMYLYSLSIRKLSIKSVMLE